MATEQEFILRKDRVPFAAFSEWAGRTPPGASMQSTGPGNCPVCGKADHSCTGREVTAVAQAKKKALKKAADRVSTPQHLVEDQDKIIADSDDEASKADDDANDSDETNDSDAEVDNDNDGEGEGDDEAGTDNAAETVQEATERYYPGQPKDGIVLGPDDPLRVEGKVIGNEVHLTKPVYRANQPSNSHRWMFYQLYGRGAVVPKSMVETVVES